MVEWSSSWGADSEWTVYDIIANESGDLFCAANVDGHPAFLRFSSSGVLLWNKSWGEGYDGGSFYAVVNDSQGNFYLAGGVNVGGVSKSNMSLVKYNSAGTKLWEKIWTEHKYGDGANDLVVDSSDDVIMVGDCYTDANKNDVCLLKYTSNGVKSWNKSWGSTNHEYGEAIEIDSLDNLYVASRLLNGSSYDATLIKFDSGGTYQWNSTWGGTNNDYGKEIALNSTGNGIYVAGHTESYGAKGLDFLLVKYDMTGNREWNSTWRSIGTDFCYDMYLDSNENVFISGSDKFAKFSGTGIFQYNHSCVVDNAIYSDGGGRVIVGGSETTGIGLARYGIDTDGDGLTDSLETYTYFTNITNPDTDYDNLTDYAEVITYLTNATNKDTDYDNLTDWYEVIHKPCLNATNNDTDGDTYTDYTEIIAGTNPCDATDYPSSTSNLIPGYPIEWLLIWSLAFAIGVIIYHKRRKKYYIK